MKVFLTGATGYVGSVVAEKLRAGGHAVIGLARTENAANALQQQGLTPFVGDLSNSERLAEGARDADAVIHTAASRGPQASEWEVNATRAMLRALDNYRPFVSTSGSSVYGDTGETVVTEDAPVVASWRTNLEREVLHAPNVRGIVVRPPLVYGRSGGALARLVTHARNTGVARFVGDGENAWSFVHVDDLAGLYVTLLERAEGGTVVNASGSESVTMRRAAEAISQGVGAEVGTWTLEDAVAVVGPIQHALVRNVRVSGQRARERFGWQPQGLDPERELKGGSYASSPNKGAGHQR